MDFFPSTIVEPYLTVTCTFLNQRIHAVTPHGVTGLVPAPVEMTQFPDCRLHITAGHVARCSAPASR